MRKGFVSLLTLLLVVVLVFAGCGGAQQSTSGGGSTAQSSQSQEATTSESAGVPVKVTYDEVKNAFYIATKDGGDKVSLADAVGDIIDVVKSAIGEDSIYLSKYSYEQSLTFTTAKKHDYTEVDAIKEALSRAGYGGDDIFFYKDDQYKLGEVKIASKDVDININDKGEVSISIGTRDLDHIFVVDLAKVQNPNIQCIKDRLMQARDIVGSDYKVNLIEAYKGTPYLERMIVDFENGIDSMDKSVALRKDIYKNWGLEDSGYYQKLCDNVSVKIDSYDDSLSIHFQFPEPSE